MTTPLTPVEALQHEIELAQHEVRTSEGAFRYNKLAVKYLAALELAKADAELHDHIPFTPDHAPSTCGKCLFHGVRVSNARTKLYESLQR